MMTLKTSEMFFKFRTKLKYDLQQLVCQSYNSLLYTWYFGVHDHIDVSVSFKINVEIWSLWCYLSDEGTLSYY